MHFVVIGNPENRRVISFVEEIRILQEHTFMVLSYSDLLDRPLHLAQQIPPHSIIKIDSPGENSWVRKRLIEYGGNIVHAAFMEDFGRICFVAEWYQGFCLFLSDLKRQIPSTCYWMNDVDSILTMFDKVACKAILSQNKIPTPISLGEMADYQALRHQMKQQCIHSVFIKPAHSSSASGVIAFRTNGNRMEAMSSMEMVVQKEDIAFYNALKVRKYQKETEIIVLINEILKNKHIVEQWIPKAAFHEMSFDFRIMVIGGKARHVVARMSKSPITNLHLGNARGNLSEIIAFIGLTTFEKVKKIAESAATCFPNSLYMGVDILISSNLKHIKVLEINAFGDLLPNLMDAGERVYQAEISEMNYKIQKHNQNIL
jgi:glutathione synthase/RimK-type ligase-like ATP-grasp enzyme